MRCKRGALAYSGSTFQTAKTVSPSLRATCPPKLDERRRKRSNPEMWPRRQAGLLRRVAPRNDGVRHAPAFSRRSRARVLRRSCPSKSEGAGKVAGRTHGPPAKRKAGGSHHRSARSSGLPCATVLTVSFVLSSGTGLSCPRRSRASQAHELGLSVGRPGPHDFAVRAGIARLATPARPSHPALHVRDDAYAPLHEHGTATHNHMFSEKTKQNIFAPRS